MHFGGRGMILANIESVEVFKQNTQIYRKNLSYIDATLLSKAANDREFRVISQGYIWTNTTIMIHESCTDYQGPFS